MSATDKAVKFISGNNNQQTLTLGKVLNTFSPEKESARSGRNSCISVTKKGFIFSWIRIIGCGLRIFLFSIGQSKNEGHETGLVFNLQRRKRHVYSFSEDYDAYDVFSVSTLRELKLNTLYNVEVVFFVELWYHYHNKPTSNHKTLLQWYVFQVLSYKTLNVLLCRTSG